MLKTPYIKHILWTVLLVITGTSFIIDGQVLTVKEQKPTPQRMTAKYVDRSDQTPDLNLSLRTILQSAVTKLNDQSMLNAYQLVIQTLTLQLQFFIQQLAPTLSVSQKTAIKQALQAYKPLLAGDTTGIRSWYNQTLFALKPSFDILISLFTQMKQLANASDPNFIDYGYYGKLPTTYEIQYYRMINTIINSIITEINK